MTPDELAEIEAAAESAGQALSEWLRGTALSAARQRPVDPTELVLAEVWAVRYTLLNLFHAASQAASEKVTPEKFNQLLDQISEAKHQLAVKLQPQGSEKPQPEKSSGDGKR